MFSTCSRRALASVRQFSSSITRTQDLSIGKIPFLSIANLRINDSHPPINLLPKFDLNLLESPYGHLYYHTPSDGRSAVFSQLRFRNEETGQDWILPNKIPWSLHLWRIIKNPDLAPLKELLVRDGVVSEAFIERCDRLFPAEFATAAPNRVISGLGQHFPVHICRNKTILWIVGEEKVLDLHIGSSWLGYPHTRQKNHKGTTMIELYYDNSRGYCLRVVREPPKVHPTRQRSIEDGRSRKLRCYSLTYPDYLPVLEELVGRDDLHY
ncbi:hypothetical protein BDP27DRAFT_1323336 [Rhodocollybia butyracea]|uniref:Uncharacterized protein n=1 Tax=Rhodocollybia butyracea TaxID=206335 RepID=A0A9P5PZ85_9AGAR|nr:hypothetical protein BDP27DRAFT_1323336 [Rhodocollybia butyracea]